MSVPATGIAACGGLDLLIIESFQRNASFDEFALEDVVHVPELRLVLGRQDQVLALELDVRLAPLKVETLRNLFGRLIYRVRDLGVVGLRNDVE